MRSDDGRLVGAAEFGVVDLQASAQHTGLNHLHVRCCECVHGYVVSMFHGSCEKLDALSGLQDRRRSVERIAAYRRP
jgi:hypothetical protein